MTAIPGSRLRNTDLSGAHRLGDLAAPWHVRRRDHEPTFAGFNSTIRLEIRFYVGRYLDSCDSDKAGDCRARRPKKAIASMLRKLRPLRALGGRGTIRLLHVLQR